MELLTLISSFLLALSFLSPHCASHQINLQTSLQQDDHESKITQVSLPRKLMNLHEETVRGSSDTDFMPTKKLVGPSTATKQHEQGEKAAEKGAWKEIAKEEEEGVNKSEYFTMDYGWVRRRRPIHNKQIPFVP